MRRDHHSRCGLAAAALSMSAEPQAEALWDPAGNGSNDVEPHTFTGPVPCPAVPVQEAAASDATPVAVSEESASESSAWSKAFQWISSAVHFSG